MSEVTDGQEATVHDWVKQAMINQKITEYQSSIVSGSGKGEGYIGDVTFVKVVGKSNDGEEKEFQFVVKIGKENAVLRKQAPIENAYKNEIYMYTKVFPAYQEFHKKHNIKEPFEHAPKYFWNSVYGGLELIILENLKPKGFELYDKYKPMNLDHLKLIYKHYAKWHGASLAMRALQPEMFKELSAKCINVFRGFMVEGGIIDGMLETLESVYPLFENENGILEKYKKLAKNGRHIFLDLIDQDDKYNVISHGDCWNNNYLFKYDDADKTKPTDICILDWQLSTLCSPIYDLSYNLYVCASKNELDHFDELLQTYHESLSDILSQFGLDPNKVFSYDTLMEQWKKYSKFGFLHSIYILTFVVCTKDEAPDLSNANQEDGFKSLMHIKLKDNPLYNQRVRDIVHHFVNRFVD